MTKQFLELVRSVCIMAVVVFVFSVIVGLFDGFFESFESFFLDL